MRIHIRVRTLRFTDGNPPDHSDYDPRMLYIHLMPTKDSCPSTTNTGKSNAKTMIPSSASEIFEHEASQD